MSAKHTPGPWHIGEANLSDHSDSHIGIRSDEWVVCEVQTDVDELPGEANARLIAAAPEMLEGLLEAEAGLESAIAKLPPDQTDFVSSERLALNVVRAVIAKATGSAA